MHSNMSDFEICKTFCAISINAGDISQLPLACTSTKAIYCEYSLINHMCKSNCDWEQENGGVSVYTFNLMISKKVSNLVLAM